MYADACAFTPHPTKYKKLSRQNSKAPIRTSHTCPSPCQPHNGQHPIHRHHHNNKNRHCDRCDELSKMPRPRHHANSNQIACLLAKRVSQSCDTATPFHNASQYYLQHSQYQLTSISCCVCMFANRLFHRSPNPKNVRSTVKCIYICFICVNAQFLSICLYAILFETIPMTHNSCFCRFFRPVPPIFSHLPPPTIHLTPLN